jgi:Zn finger protein HypA/HybF involved in hydrogenase expression
MSQSFQRNIENFTCLHCNAEVVGNGYTNHCPKCLWSQHVDIFPGDRQAECKGMMKPVEVENKKGDWVIIHECVLCGYNKANTVSKEDDMKILLEIARERAEKTV